MIKKHPFSLTNKYIPSPLKQILAVQYVDVAMFSNGKFKNVVAVIDTTEGCPVSSGSGLKRQFQLTPARGAIKNWIALEEFYDRESALASTVARADPQEKNVFAIYVSYYIKVIFLFVLYYVHTAELRYCIYHYFITELTSGIINSFISTYHFINFIHFKDLFITITTGI